MNISVLNWFVWKKKCFFLSFPVTKRRKIREKHGAKEEKKEHINLFQWKEKNAKRKTIESDTCSTNEFKAHTEWARIRGEKKAIFKKYSHHTIETHKQRTDSMLEAQEQRRSEYRTKDEENKCILIRDIYIFVLVFHWINHKQYT